MSTSKLKQRKRDGIYYIDYHQNGQRIRISLATRDYNQALVIATKYGMNHVPTIAPILYGQTQKKVSYIEAVNKFLLTDYNQPSACALVNIKAFIYGLSCINRENMYSPNTVEELRPIS